MSCLISTGGVKVVNMMLRLDAVSIFPAKCPMTEMASRMCEALRRQVLAAGSCVHKYSKVCIPIGQYLLITILPCSTLTQSQATSQFIDIYYYFLV